MPAYRLGDKAPKIANPAQVFIAPGSHIIGDVTLSDGCSVWFNAVLRGDNEPIMLGAGTNVQDGAILHTDPGFPLTTDTNVTIGHGAMLHGCSIGNNSLIGMGAVVLNGTKIGKNCLIGARAFIGEGKEIPDNSLVVGSPGKIIRTFTDAEAAPLALSGLHYREKIALYRDQLQQLD